MNPLRDIGETTVDRTISYVHASAVAIKESCVLILGPSGAGKSSLALALIAGSEAPGVFARLVGDDRVGLEARGDRLIARGHPSIPGQIERRGHGIFVVPFISAAIVGLVVELDSMDEASPRFPERDDDRILLAGVSLPLMKSSWRMAASDRVFSVLQQLRLPRIAP